MLWELPSCATKISNNLISLPHLGEGLDGFVQMMLLMSGGDSSPIADSKSILCDYLFLLLSQYVVFSANLSKGFDGFIYVLYLVIC